MKRCIHIFLPLLICALSPLAEGAVAHEKRIIRVHITSSQQQQWLATQPFDFATPVFPDRVDIVVDDRDEARLSSLGFHFSELPDEYSPLRKSARQTANHYRTFNEMVQYLQACNRDYPAITRLYEIGKSLEGRTIYALKVSDHPELEENDEPGVMYVGNIHAREVITPEIIFYFLDHLLKNYSRDDRISRIVDQRQLWLIPTINPDGHLQVELGDRWWRKNRRVNPDGSIGVDLNRNFGYKWGIDDLGSSPAPADETYRGPFGFSEPEAQVLRDFVRQHRIDASLMYHSYGNVWLFPWSYSYLNTPHHAVFLEMGREMSQANNYTPGNSKMGTIYLVNGDSDDYFYGDLIDKDRIFAFTPEVGTTFYPREESILRLVDENLDANLYLAETAGLLKPNPFRALPPAAPILTITAPDDDGQFRVSWRPAKDSLNTARLFDVAEWANFASVTDSAESISSLWNYASFSTSEQKAFSGRKSYYSATVQPIRADMTLRFPVRVQTTSQFVFKTWYDLESNYDYFYVQASLDQGKTFTNISGNLSRLDNPSGRNQGFGMTGSSGGWQNAVFDLSAYKGQDVLLRIRHVTEGETKYGGLFLDQIGPLYLPQTSAPIVQHSSDTLCLRQKSGQGSFAYRVRGYDVDGQTSVWSRPSIVQVDFGRVADINRDDRLDLLDVQRCAELAVAAGKTATRGELWRANLDGSSENGMAAITVLDAVRLARRIRVTPSPQVIESGESALSLGQASGRPGETIRVPIRLRTGQSIAGWQVQIMQKPAGGIRVDSIKALHQSPDFIMAFKDSQAVQLSAASYLLPAGEYDLAELYAHIPASAGTAVDSLHFGPRTWLATLDGQQVDSVRFLSGYVNISRSTTDVVETAVPNEYRLEQNYPNPFNQQTILAFSLAEAGHYTLTLFDIQGREVETIHSGFSKAGRHLYVWQSRDQASGVYMLRLQVNGFTAWRKLILLK
jgi:hypothetical protein